MIFNHSCGCPAPRPYEYQRDNDYLIFFHKPNHRNFKKLHPAYIWQYRHKYFFIPLSYTRFVSVNSSVLVQLFTHLKSKQIGLTFIDPLHLRACHNLRIPRHKVFDDIAKRGKTTIGWLYGVKLHLIVYH
ncbi:hypothetical protein C6H64_21925 [Photorhabdus luminescens]|uniref:transposase n=1 Tax=Photorhabdus akhurstii TaxID=171438 RepID=UPI000CF95D60|nr:hypothetical protein C6H64_21925 [Photorhabdus luminescens]PQQ27541.1 hypothetical protein C6H69_20330 [Photorhabdus luminescens]